MPAATNLHLVNASGPALAQPVRSNHARATGLLTRDFEAVVAALAATSFLVSFHLGPIFAIAQSRRQAKHAGTGFRDHSVDGDLLRPGCRAARVGMINDALRNDHATNAMRYSLLSAAVTTVLGALLFIWAARSIREDIKRAS